MTNDPFSRPTPVVGGGESYPANFQLVGRLLIFWPLTFAENVKSTLKDKDDNDVYQDVITADTAVLDGEPLTAKVDYATRQPKEPFPFPLMAPIEFAGMTWSQTQVVKGLRAQVGTGNPVMARLIYGTKGRNGFTPMKLEDPTPADIELGKRYLAQREAIKAHWAQRFAAVGMGPAQQQAQAGSPFAQPQQQYQQPAQQQQYQQGYQQPAPVQDQPWNPYNGQQQAPPAQVPQWQPPVQQQQAPASFSPVQAQQTGNGWGTPEQAQATADQNRYEQGTWPNWNQSNPSEHQAWTPTPDGPPPGWGN